MLGGSRGFFLAITQFPGHDFDCQEQSSILYQDQKHTWLATCVLFALAANTAFKIYNDPDPLLTIRIVC